MKFIGTNFSGLWVVESEPFTDQRGFFARTYCRQEFQHIGLEEEFVQHNFSFNVAKGTVRGLHYQLPPYTETKYLRCVQGNIFDVVVDLRKNSPTYLKHFSIELSFSNMLGLIVPQGCAHGFQVLEDNTSVVYFHTQFYQQGFERGIKFDDPVIDIKWPLEVTYMSDRDKEFPPIDNKFEPIQL